jgi:hypothetical protein
MKRHLWFLLLVVALFLAGGVTVADGQGQPIQLALFNPIQLVSESESISGLRLNLIYSKNVSVTGLDVGLVNNCSGGLSVGIQWSLVGINNGAFKGWQYSVVSITRENFEGLQMGLYNTAGHMSGLQLGFINHANTMKGVQIGLLNLIDTGGAFPLFPIVNWSF